MGSPAPPVLDKAQLLHFEAMKVCLGWPGSGDTDCSSGFSIPQFSDHDVARSSVVQCALRR